MPAFPPIYVLRHGQTEWNLQRRYQGYLNSPLTILGRAQATDQGAILTTVFAAHPQVRVVCSPQGRARQTAEIVLAGHDIAVEFDPRIAEISVGVWAGMDYAAIATKWPKLFNDGLTAFESTLNAVGGEGYDGLRARCQDFLASVTEPMVVISHGITCMMIRGLVCGLDFEAMTRLPMTQGCVFALIEGKEQIMTR